MALQDKANAVVTSYNACLTAAGVKAATTAALNTATAAYNVALNAFAANGSNANAQALAVAAGVLNAAQTADTDASTSFGAAMATLTTDKGVFLAGLAPFA